MNIARQLKDIQLQADILLSGRPTMTEIVEFHNYNEEVKSYLPTYIKDEELLSRINSIPVIIDETNAQNVSRNAITIVFAFLLSWAVAYFRDRQKIENALKNVHEAKGMYSSIEFLTRSI